MKSPGHRVGCEEFSVYNRNLQITTDFNELVYLLKRDKVIIQMKLDQINKRRVFFHNFWLIINLRQDP